VELCLEAPVNANFQGPNGRGGKGLLREAFADLIPPANRRAAKRGFCPPLLVWMERYFDSYFDTCLPRSYVEEHGIFDYDVIQELRAQQCTRTRDNSMELFGILMFDAWYRRYITAERPDALMEIAA
jgi:asparagine synthase (glutamine-hydrolysing)